MQAPQAPQEVYVVDPAAEQRIARLESQVEGLRKAVRELADALQEELSAYDARISALDDKSEEIFRVQTSQARVLKKQDERLRKSLGIIADALSGLSGSGSTSEGAM